MKEVVLPLAVMRQSGIMEVTVEAVSQIRRDIETLEIEVKVRLSGRMSSYCYSENCSRSPPHVRLMDSLIPQYFHC